MQSIFNDITPELEEKLNTGKVVLGGCMVSESDPKYRCNDCKKNFGAPHVKMLKDGILFDCLLETPSLRFYLERVAQYI